MIYVLMLLIFVTLVWIGAILLRISNSVEAIFFELDRPIAESVAVAENIPSKKARVFNPGKDPMAEFSGKRDDWYGDVE